MIEELVRRWQIGWSLSRGATAVDESDGVLSIKLYQEDRSVEYVVLDADSHPSNLERAIELATGSARSWVTVVTQQRQDTIRRLKEAGLDVHKDREWLMTTPLDDQPPVALHPDYSLVAEPDHDVIVIRAQVNGAVASSGRMAVVGTDAVA
ncbi:MAG: GNAT family N-acetyltransferase, partial [Nocardioidaceae bacterium]